MKRNERYGLKQSNSLQNLLDDSHYQLNSNQSHTSNKKHHQRRKNSTSVSARRLEGGSLPIDMHHSSTVQSPSDQPFLSEYKNSKKRKEKQQKETVIDIGENETDEKKLMQRSFDGNKDVSPHPTTIDAVSLMFLHPQAISSSYPHDGIEMKSISFTNSIEMDIAPDSGKFPSGSAIPTCITTSSIAASGGTPLATASIVHPKVTSSAAATSVDKSIEYLHSCQQQRQIIDTTGSTINPNNNIVLTPGLNYNASNAFKQGVNESLGLQMDTMCPAVASVTGNDKVTAKIYSNKPNVSSVAPRDCSKD